MAANGKQAQMGLGDGSERKADDRDPKAANGKGNSNGFEGRRRRGPLGSGEKKKREKRGEDENVHFDFLDLKKG